MKLAAAVLAVLALGGASATVSSGVASAGGRLGVVAAAAKSPAATAAKAKKPAAVAKSTGKACTTASCTWSLPEIDAGLRCIVGGALAHLVLGTLYTWGNFMSYSPPSLRFFDGKEHPGSAPDALYVIPLTLLAQAAAMPFGPGLVSKFGPSKTLLLGSLLTAASVYAASFQTRLGLFMFFYSIVFGTGVGLGYTAPMIAGWKWKPNAKGLVSGGILAGFGTGGFIFSLIGTKLVNPNGLNPVKGVFPQEVYDNFPKMLRTLAGLYALTATLGSLLVTEPAVSTSASAGKGKAVVVPPLAGLTVQQALFTPQFWMLWAMIVSSGSAGLTVSSIYKQFAAGAPALAGDGYQATVGGLGALFNGFSRLAWGVLADKIGFKKSFTILTLLQATLMATYGYSTSSKAAFTANTCLLFLCLAGNLALMPSAAQKMFGPRAGATIYGVLFNGFGIASVFGSSLTKALAASYGWKGTFGVLSAFSLLATVIVAGLQPIATLPGSAV